LGSAGGGWFAFPLAQLCGAPLEMSVFTTKLHEKPGSSCEDTPQGVGIVKLNLPQESTGAGPQLSAPQPGNTRNGGRFPPQFPLSAQKGMQTSRTVVPPSERNLGLTLPLAVHVVQPVIASVAELMVALRAVGGFVTTSFWVESPEF
jgi:hypothetical protein